MTLIEGLTALAMIVIVPLATRPAERLVLAACGLVGSITFFLDQGLAAAAAVLPWTAGTLWLALPRVVSLMKAFRVETAWRLLPHGYLVFGTGWLILSRYGVRPLDFGHTIVALTAVHFHYAGFIAPNLLCRLEGWLMPDHPKRRRVVTLCLWGVIAATPLTAAGITFASIFGAIGASIFGWGLITTATITLSTISIRKEGAAAALIQLSALSICVGVALGVLYAVGQWLGTWAPTIPTMSKTHGLLNAFGFSLAGVLGWNALENRRNFAAGDPNDERFSRAGS